MQTCEVACLDAVGLDAAHGAARCHGRGDHVAGNPERAEQPVGLVAGPVNFVACDCGMGGSSG